jgi:hypothetical protein
VRQSCGKGAEGSTLYCKAHGGGKRCGHEGCPKSAAGSTRFCIGHGGGRRCNHQIGTPDACSHMAVRVSYYSQTARRHRPLNV